MPTGTAKTVLDFAQQFVDDLAVPVIGKEVTKEYSLDFSNLMDADNHQLEEFIAMFGGYRAYLENQLAEITATKTAIEASFNENYSAAIYKLADERESLGKKKFTREEIRGAAFATYPTLPELRKEVMAHEAVYIRINGLLSAYKAAYDSVSRIITIRNLGREQAWTGQKL